MSFYFDEETGGEVSGSEDVAFGVVIASDTSLSA